jgi:glycosyltransferase involved in cell wall biosynthesis
VDKLSVIIITLNEERNIERALKSLVNIADEIIVLDSFSTDETTAICKQYPVRLIQEKWQGYAATKNFANNLATHNWIFSLDADEEVDELLDKEILAHKEAGFSGTYSVNRLTNYCGKWIKHSTWYPDKKVRIFEKSNAVWGGEFVHEELEFIKEVQDKELAGHLNHFSYYDYVDHRSRADKYSVLTAKKLHAAGKTAGALKPYVSSVARFITMFILNLGFLDGWAGFKIAQISAQSNVVKYKELRKLNKKNG